MYFMFHSSFGGKHKNEDNNIARALRPHGTRTNHCFIISIIPSDTKSLINFKIKTNLESNGNGNHLQRNVFEGHQI